MKIIKLSIYVFICILFSSLAFAEPAFIFPPNRNATIDLPVYKSDITKSETGTCSLTVINPNGTIIVDDVTMTRSGHHYLYTIDGTLLNEFGEYGADVSCTDGDSGASTFFFEVNSEGKRRDGGNFGIVIGIVLIGITGLFTLLSIIAGRGEHRGWQIAFLLIAFMMMVVDVRFAAAVAESSTLNDGLINSLNSVYSIFMNIFVFIFFLGGAYSIILVFKQLDPKRRAERKRQLRDEEWLIPK